MSKISDNELKLFKKKYKKKLETEFDPEYAEEKEDALESVEFRQFVDETKNKDDTLYEKLCNFSEKTLRVKPDKKKAEELMDSISMAKLNITPTGAVSFSLLAPIVLVVFGGMLGYMLLNSMYILIFFVISGAAIMYPLGRLPNYYASSERMKASNQMVQCIFYVVTYMRHTSNLEKAVEFAGEHLAPPLSLDLKQVLWNVETEKFESVRESLDDYLDMWRKYNMEFVEAFHLIESSLFESSNERRLALLDKSLDVILDETYEKMLHFSQELKSPITTLHMLGVIMPILGLVILPLVVSFMQNVQWYHISVIYNVALPVMVYFMGKNIMVNRPSGYGDAQMSKEYQQKQGLKLKLGKKEVGISSMHFSVAFLVIFLLIGFTPLIIHAFNPEFDTIILGEDLLGYKPSVSDSEVIVGPYGMGASVLSFFVTAGLAFSIGLFYRLKSTNIIKIREEAKRLEAEFASALFQLGNRLADGLPSEIAFGKVAGVMEGTISGNFFRQVSTNIQKMGMGVEEAIFDPRVGALSSYPSNIIESSMKVLVQSAKKGPKIAAQAVLNVARYIKEIHRVDERLKDLMAETISSMKSQIKFLTPVISGVVIGITSMIVNIIGKLGVKLRAMDAEGTATNMSLAEMFNDGLPTFYFQIIVGLYVVQITYILTVLANTIENGSDKISENYQLGINMIKGPLLYIMLSMIVMLLFNMVAKSLDSLGG